jgi:hypothetical protein
MKQYIFQQTDNSESYNFIEKTDDLLAKLCKNEKSADVIDREEANIAHMCLDLLIEVTTGSCPRNQEFLSVCGLVERAQKVLRAPFRFLRSLGHEAYPSEVRLMKSKIVLLLQTLLELRQDEIVHRNFAFRTDTGGLKQRIMFIHRWFLGDTLKLSNAAVAVSEASDWYAVIDDAAADDGIVVPETNPFILLESVELTEDQLSDYFNEAFIWVMLKKELGKVSEAFKESTDPIITPFEDDISHYVNEEQYRKAKQVNVLETKYLAAYDFFNLWINVIEISLDGTLFDQYFRMPKLSNFVLGRTKMDIVNNVSIESPGSKAKNFCSMTQDAYVQTMHTLYLSQWGCRFPGVKPIKPFNFFLKNDSYNLINIQRYCLGVASVLSLLD